MGTLSGATSVPGCGVFQVTAVQAGEHEFSGITDTLFPMQRHLTSLSRLDSANGRQSLDIMNVVSSRLRLLKLGSMISVVSLMHCVLCRGN